MAPSRKILSAKTFCIITGSSSGIGRAMAIAIAKEVGEKSVMVITGLDAADLDETQRLLREAAPSVQVRSIAADLTDQAAFPNLLAELTKDIVAKDFQHCLLINNAGSLGDTSRFMRDLSSSDVEYVQDYCMLNLTSAFLLTSHFLSTFPAREGLRRTVINLTSFAAIRPARACGLYCMGKSARSMWFKILAAEEPDVRVLNYAPGLCDTALFRQFTTQCVDDGVRNAMAGMLTNQQLLKPDDSAAKLVKILEEDAFESGEHVHSLGQKPHAETFG